MRVLLVGAGRFGVRHLGVLVGLGVDVVVADVDDAAIARARAVAPSARFVRRVADALDGADAVVVAVPVEAHVAVVREALGARLPVLCEKPLAPTLDEAVALAELASESGVILATGFLLRHHPAIAELHRLVRAGTLGAPRALIARTADFKRPRLDGGCATNDAIHFVDLSARLLAKPILRARALVRDHLGGGQEDLAFLDFDFGRELAHVEASHHGPKRERRLTLLCDEAAAVVDLDADPPRVIVTPQRHVRDATGAFTIEAGEERRIDLARADPLRAQAESFLESVRSNAPAACDAWAGVRATAALETAFRAATDGGWLEVPAVDAR